MCWFGGGCIGVAACLICDCLNCGLCACIGWSVQVDSELRLYDWRCWFVGAFALSTVGWLLCFG